MPTSSCRAPTAGWRPGSTGRLASATGGQSCRVRQAIRSRSDLEAPLGSAWQIVSGRDSTVAGLTVGQSEFVILDCCGSSCRSHVRRTASRRRSCTPEDPLGSRRDSPGPRAPDAEDGVLGSDDASAAEGAAHSLADRHTARSRPRWFDIETSPCQHRIKTTPRRVCIQNATVDILCSGRG